MGEEEKKAKLRLDYFDTMPFLRPEWVKEYNAILIKFPNLKYHK